MAQVISVAGRGTMTKHGKAYIASSMYGKGKAFVGAHLLVAGQDCDEPAQYVALHLLAQGVEVVLKALLLHLDYDRYSSMLRRPLGHNLVRAAEMARKAYGLNPLNATVKNELEQLNAFYAEHRLRYGNFADAFYAPSSITTGRVLRRVKAVLRLAERKPIA